MILVLAWSADNSFFNRSGPPGIADVSHDLPISATKTKFKVGPFISLLPAHTTLTGKCIHVYLIEAECGKHGIVFEPMDWA